ncbi:DUF6081 family protein [Kitasatospora sp. NPDC058965]|uniref:DUF6081 family protein n=1 Tax=Kitasatospora sp. NPDC058965 TaxID=3346682 RepID=UPI0036B41B64
MTSQRTLLFRDGFAAGPDRWEPRPDAADGRATTGPDGLDVVPAGVDPATGRPAFARPTGPEPPSAFLRWAAVARATASSGLPGFDARDGELLSCSAELAVEVDGTPGVPGQPAADVKAGAGALLAFDRASGMVFDFALTRSTVYAIYERLPGGGHHAFSCAVPLGPARPGDFHHCELGLDPAAGTVRWTLDGTPRLTVDRIGEQVFDEPERLLWTVPGRVRPATVRQLAFGLALLADRPTGQGVRLRARSVTVTTG